MEARGSKHSSSVIATQRLAKRNRAKCSTSGVQQPSPRYMSTAAPQPSPRVTPDKEPMAQNKKIYVLDCGGQYCHLIASRLRRHEALSVIVPRAAAS